MPSSPTNALLLTLTVGGALAFIVFSGGVLTPRPPAAAPPAAPLAVGDGHLRFDGIYRAPAGGGKSPLCLRFYPEGDVVAWASTDAANQVAALLSRHRENILRSRYQLQASGVDFVFTTPMGSIAYEGMVGEERILCSFQSRITGSSGTAQFEFSPVAFPSD